MKDYYKFSRKTMITFGFVLKNEEKPYHKFQSWHIFQSSCFDGVGESCRGKEFSPIVQQLETDFTRLKVWRSWLPYNSHQGLGVHQVIGTLDELHLSHLLPKYFKILNFQIMRFSQTSAATVCQMNEWIWMKIDCLTSSWKCWKCIHVLKQINKWIIFIGCHWQLIQFSLSFIKFLWLILTFREYLFSKNRFWNEIITLNAIYLGKFKLYSKCSQGSLINLILAKDWFLCCPGEDTSISNVTSEPIWSFPFKVA